MIKGTIVVVQLLSWVRLFTIPWTAACQASLTFTVSQIWLRFMSIQSVMLSNNVILYHPFSFCLQSFPTVGSFPVSQFFTSGDQSIGASASGPVLSVNIQACFPLGLIGLNSLLANGLLRVFFSRTIRKHQFFRTQPSLWSNFHICTWLLGSLLAKWCLCFLYQKYLAGT